MDKDFIDSACIAPAGTISIAGFCALASLAESLTLGFSLVAYAACFAGYMLVVYPRVFKVVRKFYVKSLNKGL